MTIAPLHDDAAGMDAHGGRGKRRGLLLSVWAFAALVVLLLAFTYYSIVFLSAARAYVGGEGLWSKAQKEAVHALLRYTMYRDAQDYASFRNALTVSMGDRQARLELEKPEPDFAQAEQGFLQGRNHPDDISGMVLLFRTFRDVPEIDRAIAIWARGDALVDQLVLLGDRIHEAAQAGPIDAEVSRAFLGELHTLDSQFTPLEDAFSAALSEASRKTRAFLIAFVLIVGSVLLVAAFVYSRRMVQLNEDVQHALAASETQLRSLVQFAPLPIIIVRDGDESVVYANDRALAQFKVPAERMREFKAPRFYVRPRDRELIVSALRSVGSVRDREVQLQDVYGKPFWALLSSRRLAFGGEECMLSALVNIDDRRRAQEELRHRAFHDELTGLPNRAMFMDAVRRTLHRLSRHEGSFAILFIDLDEFKEVNDRFGHAVGDLLLRAVAQRIRLCVREGDLVARLGGDEFVILVEGDESPADAQRIAQKIVAALDPVHDLEGQTVHVTSSIGISRYPGDGAQIGELLRQADASMYRAKQAGRNPLGDAVANG